MSDVAERAEQSLEGVTEGPWTVETGDYGNVHDASVWVDWGKGYPLFVCPDCGVRGSTHLAVAKFVVDSRSLLPELVAVVKGKDAEIAQLREQLIDAHLEILEEKTEYWHDVPMRPSERDQITDADHVGMTLHEHLGLTDAEGAHYVCNPREFMRQRPFGSGTC